jgi:hypothetical protein
MKKIPIWRRYARLLGADPAGDVEDELRFHLETKADDLMVRGWRPDAARAEAERQFGDVRTVQHIGEKLGENMERRKRFNEYLVECNRDVLYTLRTLRNNPGYAAVAILVLALGIGVNAAVFSVANTLLLRPLPFADSQRLVWFEGGKSIPEKIRAAAGLSGRTYTADAYEEFKRNNQSFQAVTTYQTFYGSIQYKLTGSGEPKQLSVVEVADNFFSTLGIQPAAGRDFTKEECQKGGPPAALLSYYFWKSQFAGDPAIVGKAVTMNDKQVTVVGVLPASFDFGSVFAPGTKVDVFVPAVMDFWRTWGNTLAIVGRLKPGVSVAQAQDEADRLFPHLKDDSSRLVLGLRFRVDDAQRSCQRQAAPFAGGAVVRRRRDSSNRVREPFQPATEPRGHAQQRDGHASRTGREPRQAHPPTAHGEPRAFCWRGCAGPLLRVRNCLLHRASRLHDVAVAGKHPR